MKSSSTFRTPLLMLTLGFHGFALLLALSITYNASVAQADELAATDFVFNGQYGSQGAQLQRIGSNHFRLTLAAAPGHANWPNLVQFEIPSGARGNPLTLDAVFTNQSGIDTAYGFLGFRPAYSYDGSTWHSRSWTTIAPDHGRVTFPAFEQDRVLVSAATPFSPDVLETLIQQWRTHPDFTVKELGRSLQGRPIYRLTITAMDSPHPPEQRWVHYFAHQHTGEYQANWRMVGMIERLLENGLARTRERAVHHFVVLSNPDAVSNGWYRVNSQGLDMNKTYAQAGANPDQGHEPYIVQRDLENIMASNQPATTIWSMHVWPGPVHLAVDPGPEMEHRVGSAEDMASLLAGLTTTDIFAPLQINSGRAIPSGDYLRFLPPTPAPSPTGQVSETGKAWNNGPHLQFKVTTFLCEGGNSLDVPGSKSSGHSLLSMLERFYPGLNSIWTEAPQLQIVTSSLPTAKVGTPYNVSLQAQHALGALTWALEGNQSLPQGLTLQGAAIRGTPTQSGDYSITLRAEDESYQSKSRIFTVRVSAATTAAPAPPADLRLGVSSGS